MKRAIYFVLLAIAVVVIYSAGSIWQYGKQTSNAVTHTAIVLGAAVWESEPSPVFRARIDHAISLYETERVTSIIFTGGAAKGELSEAEVAKRYAMEKGIPEEAIYIESTSTITEENLRNAKVVMEEQFLETATIISDPLHMKRAMYLAQKLQIDAYSSPTPTTMYTSLKTQLPFLCREVFYYIGTLLINVLINENEPQVTSKSTISFEEQRDGTIKVISLYKE